MSNHYEPKNNDSMYLGGESDWKQMWPKYDEINGLPSAKLFQGPKQYTKEEQEQGWAEIGAASAKKSEEHKKKWPKAKYVVEDRFEDVFYSKGHSTSEEQEKVRKAFLDRLNGNEEPVQPMLNAKGIKVKHYPTPAIERQVGGSHYKDKGSSMQPWAIIDAWGLDFYGGNVLKYILRAKHKGGLEDLQKARHYLDKMIEDADDQ